MSFQPFETTGLDYLGPMEVKVPGGSRKVWVVLFTCAVIRAVHFGVGEDLTASACSGAVRRFAALNGVTARISFNNALAFKKASRCLAGL